MAPIYAVIFLDLEPPSKRHMERLNIAWSGEAEDEREAASKVFLSTIDGDTVQVFHKMHTYVPVGIFHRKDFPHGERQPAVRQRSTP